MIPLHSTALIRINPHDPALLTKVDAVVRFEPRPCQVDPVSEILKDVPGLPGHKILLKQTVERGAASAHGGVVCPQLVELILEVADLIMHQQKWCLQIIFQQVTPLLDRLLCQNSLEREVRFWIGNHLLVSVRGGGVTSRDAGEYPAVEPSPPRLDRLPPPPPQPLSAPHNQGHIRAVWAAQLDQFIGGHPCR